MIINLAYLGQAGPTGIVRQLVSWTFQLLMAALFIRVIASWLGGFRYARWLRPVYALTDWLVIPIQRHMPPVRHARPEPARRLPGPHGAPVGRLPGPAVLTPFRPPRRHEHRRRVQPRASRNEVAGLHGSELRIRLTAPRSMAPRTTP